MALEALHNYRVYTELKRATIFSLSVGRKHFNRFWRYISQIWSVIISNPFNLVSWFLHSVRR